MEWTPNSSNENKFKNELPIRFILIIFYPYNNVYWLLIDIQNKLKNRFVLSIILIHPSPIILIQLPNQCIDIKIISHFNLFYIHLNLVQSKNYFTYIKQ